MTLDEPQFNAFMQFLRDIYYRSIVSDKNITIERKDSYFIFCRNCNEQKAKRTGRTVFYQLMRDFGFGETDTFKNGKHVYNFIFEKTLLKKTIDNCVYRPPEKQQSNKMAIKVGGEWFMITIEIEPVNKNPVTINDNLTVQPDNIQVDHI